MASIVKLQQGNTYTGFVTDVNFSAERDLTVWVQIGESIEDTLNDITAVLDNASTSAKQLTDLYVDLLCACKFVEDQQWYRASIVKKISGGKWVARFIDYGNCQVFEEFEFFCLPLGLQEIPPLATGVVLDQTVQPIDSACLWTSVVAKTLVDLLLYSEIEFTVTKTEAKPERTEILCSMINDVLVSKGLAIFPKQIYPYFEFPINHNFKAFVSSASEQGTVFIQEHNSSLDLDQLMSDLSVTLNFADNREPISLEDLKPGHLVAALYSGDQNFYRGQIIEVDQQKCTVYYFDYGNTEQQDVTSIVKLPKKFCQLPYQALECKLHNIIIPPHKHSKSLQELIIENYDGQIVFCQVLDHLHGTSKLSISFKCENDSLTALLVAKGYAKLNRCESELLEYLLVEVDIGSLYEVFISHVESNGTFYVSLVTDGGKLDKLMDELDEYCKIARPVIQITPGMPCCALYDQDNSWYRATIKSCTNDVCNVMYVDYGNTSSCPASSLRQISKDFMSLRAQAIECSILRPLTADEISVLESFVGKMVEVKFLLKTASVNSFNVKVLNDGNDLFPPLKRNAPSNFHDLKLKLDSSHSIKVLNFSSPGDMWGRLIENESSLQEMCSELNAIYSCEKGNDFTFNEKIEVGTACVVHDTSYNQWCRGEVISLSNSNFSILLIDVGITKDYSISKMRRVYSNKLYNLPGQAIHFSVVGSKIQEMYILNQSKFSSFFLNHSFSAKFIDHDKLTNLYIVELRDTNGVTIESALTETLKIPITNGVENSSPSCKSYFHTTALTTNLFVPLNDSYVEVSVCFIEDPDCMWLQVHSNSMKLFKLLKEMQSFYGQLPSNVLVFNQPQFDALCAVRVKKQGEEHWYRGRILCLYADVIEVKLIDFGNEVKVKQKDIKMLSSRFSIPEAQALRCKLFNVLPSCKQWTNGAVSDLSDIINNAKSVTAKFVERHRNSYIVDVEVADATTAKLVKVNQFLVQQNHAKWQDECLVPKEVSSFDEMTDTENIVEPDQSKFVAQVKKPKIFYQSPGVAFIGAELEIIASEVTSPDNFFLQISDACHRHKYAALMKELNEACLKTAGPQLYEDDFYVGLPCAVFYDRVEQWCRGAILNYDDLESLQICLVDYGCMINCPLYEIKAIDMSLVLKAPPEAMRCTLQGIVVPKDGKWSSNAITFCKDFFESDQRNLTCTVHACAGKNLCSYFICSVRTPMMDLADELVKAGFGEKVAKMGMLKPPFKLKSFIHSNLGAIKGHEDVFYVTHVEAPNLFYCQLSKHFSEIDGMMDQLQFHCNSEHAYVTVDELIQDCMCFAKYCDKWYRAHFVAYDVDDFVKVLFVDYGNSEVVQLCDVQKFSNEIFYKLPIQALPCSFKDIDMTSIPVAQQQQSLMLMNTILLEREFKGMVIGSTNGKLHLDLFHEGKRINEMMSRKVSMDEPNPLEANRNDLYENVRENNDVNLVEPAFVHAGAHEIVTLASCVDPHNFYLWLSKLDGERNTCMNKVDGLYTAMRNADYKLQTLIPGDIICARRSKDMKWCRAKVLSAEDNEVKVFYVDTGEPDSVLRAYDVKQLILEMGKWPIMALPCSLSGVKASTDDGWTSQAVLEFHYFITNCQLSAEFLHKDATGKWLVKLKKDEKDFSNHLIDLGVALPIPVLTEQSDLMSHNDTQIEPACIWKNEKQVYISHVVSANEVFLHSQAALEDLEKLKVLLNEDFHLKQLTSFPEKQKFFVARYSEDQQLYRAEAIDQEDGKNSDSCMVRFVDFGNTELVEMNDIYELNNVLSDVPQCAILCKIMPITTSLSDHQICTKLMDISESADVNLFGSFTQNEFGDDNVVTIRVLKPNRELVSLSAYLSENYSDVQDTRNNSGKCFNLQYTDIKNILNKASRSIYVSHVVNPGHVYCQLSEFCNDLDTLMDNVETYYQEENRPEDKVESVDMLPIGSPCIAKYAEDDAWYRAVVVAVTDSGHLQVRFVDYGNCQSLPLTDIRKSKIGFCVLPMQAIHCYVAMVDHKPESWSKEEIDDYDDRVASLQLKATFTKMVSEKDDIFEVMLRLPDGTLLNKEYMKASNRVTVSPKIFDDVSADGSLPVEKYAVDAPTPVISVIADESLPLVKHIVKPFQIDSGTVKDCYISFAENARIFYLQLADVESVLSSLYALAARDGQAADSFANSVEGFEVGSFCVAKSPDDGEWYRGLIKEASSQPLIYYIDYGNCAVVDGGLVKQISEETANRPMQAVACSLDGLSKLSTEGLDTAVDLFFDMVESALLTVKFHKKIDSVWNVSVKVSGVDVAEKIWKSVSPGSEYIESIPEIQESFRGSHPCPGTVLCGKVVFVNDINCFYVQVVDAGLVTAEVALNSCLVKRSVAQEWESAVVVQKDHANLFVVTNNGLSFPANEYCEIKESESRCSIPYNIVVCKLHFDASGGFKASDQVSQYFASHVSNENVYITLQNYNEGKWEVKLSLPGICITDLVQNFAMTQDDAPSLSPRLQNSKAEDCILYSELVFKQLKNMLPLSSIEPVVAGLINDALLKITAFKNSIVDKKHDMLLPDDHKRPFTAYASVPTPCKKPRLEKHSHSSGAEICKPTPEVNEISEADSSFPVLQSFDSHMCSVLCVESPDCFYVKAEVFDGSQIPLHGITQLTQIDNIEKNILCAFKSSSDNSNLKRGFINDRIDDSVVITDIDSGFKYVLSLEQVFSYPSEWEKYPPSVVECSLYGLSPTGQEWSTDACTYFSEVLEGIGNGTIQVDFVQQCKSSAPISKWLVKVVIEKEFLNCLLIEKDFAQKNFEVEFDLGELTSPDDADVHLSHISQNVSEDAGNKRELSSAIEQPGEKDHINNQDTVENSDSTECCNSFQFASQVDERIPGIMLAFTSQSLADASAEFENEENRGDSRWNEPSDFGSNEDEDQLLQDRIQDFSQESNECDEDKNACGVVATNVLDQYNNMNMTVDKFETPNSNDDHLLSTEHRVPSFVSFRSSGLAVDLLQLPNSSCDPATAPAFAAVSFNDSMSEDESTKLQTDLEPSGKENEVDCNLDDDFCQKVIVFSASERLADDVSITEVEPDRFSHKIEHMIEKTIFQNGHVHSEVISDHNQNPEFSFSRGDLILSETAKKDDDTKGLMEHAVESNIVSSVPNVSHETSALAPLLLASRSIASLESEISDGKKESNASGVIITSDLPLSLEADDNDSLPIESENQEISHDIRHNDVTPEDETDGVVQNPEAIDIASQTFCVKPDSVNVVSEIVNVDRETVCVISETVEVDPETVDVGSETVDVISETGDVSPETVDVILETVDVISETVNVSPETVNVPLETVDVGPETVNVISETVDISPETANVISETVDISPETVNVLLETVDVSPETVDVISETVDIRPETACVISETVDISSETACVISETVDISPETVNDVLETVDVSPETVEVISKTVVVSPETVNVLSKTVDVSPETVYVLSETVDVSPETVNVVLETVDVGPETVDVISKTVNVSLETVDVSPETACVISETVGISPETVNVVLETVDVSPETVDVISEIIDVSPETVDVISKTVDVDPETVDVISETVDVDPETADVISETVDVSPETVDVISETVDVSPETVNVLSETVDISPETVDMISEIVEVDPENVNAISETVNVNSETADVISETVDVDPETVNLIAEVNDFISKLKIEHMSDNSSLVESTAEVDSVTQESDDLHIAVIVANEPEAVTRPKDENEVTEPLQQELGTEIGEEQKRSGGFHSQESDVLSEINAIMPEELLDESGCSANVSLQSGDLTFTSAFDNTLQCLDDDEFYDAQ